MTNDTLLPFDLPAVRSKKVIADFEGGLTSLDGGLVLLREAERRFGPGRDPGRLHPGLAQAGNGGPRAVGDAASMDAPGDASKFLSGLVHAVRCCRLFGLFVRPSDAAGPYGDARIGSKSLPRP